MAAMSLLPIARCLPSRRGLSYWYAWSISERAIRSKNRERRVCSGKRHSARFCGLFLVRCGAILLRCGSAGALPPPSLGVSSLNLGRLHPRAALFSQIINKLNREINPGLADLKLKTRFADLGAIVLALSPIEYGKRIAEETDKRAKGRSEQ